MRHEVQKDTLIYYLSGELDHCCAQSVRREIDAILQDHHLRNLVLDMQDLVFMDSSGIGVILGRYRLISARGGRTAVRRMNPHVSRIFAMSGMGQIIDSI